MREEWQFQIGALVPLLDPSLMLLAEVRGVLVGVTFHRSRLQPLSSTDERADGSSRGVRPAQETADRRRRRDSVCRPQAVPRRRHQSCPQRGVLRRSAEGDTAVLRSHGSPSRTRRVARRPRRWACVNFTRFPCTKGRPDHGLTEGRSPRCRQSSAPRPTTPSRGPSHGKATP